MNRLMAILLVASSNYLILSTRSHSFSFHSQRLTQVSSLVYSDILTTIDNEIAALRYIRGLVPSINCPLSDTSKEDIQCMLHSRYDELCFKCFSLIDPSKAVYLKKINSTTRNPPNEYVLESSAMKIFSKYTPGMAPFEYHVDSEYLIFEWLEGCEMRSNFIRGEIDADSARQIGTVMGRNHARSHSLFVNSTLSEQYRTTFKNEYSFMSTSKDKFEFVLNQLQCLTDERKDRALALAFLSHANKDGHVGAAVHSLHSCFTDQKQSLVHGCLTCNNILIIPGEQSSDSDADSNIKLVNFEKFSYGPTGIDLGVYLCNHLWFYAASTRPASRRVLISSARSVLEAYKAAFFVQAVRVSKERDIHVDIDLLFGNILLDAIGFMGFYSLFLNLSNSHGDELPLHEFQEMHWGNADGWLAAVRKRQMRMSVRALQVYHQGKQPGDSVGPNAQDLIAILQEDEKHLATGHYSEFWSP